jgi:hypothetical protein
MEKYDEYLSELFKNSTHYTNEWCGEVTITATLNIPKKTWDNYKKQKQLGRLYGVETSNWLSRAGVLPFYAMPVVDDKKNAKNGIKTITVRFTKRGN